MQIILTALRLKRLLSTEKTTLQRKIIEFHTRDAKTQTKSFAKPSSHVLQFKPVRQFSETEKGNPKTKYH